MEGIKREEARLSENEIWTIIDKHISDNKLNNELRQNYFNLFSEAKWISELSIKVQNNDLNLIGSSVVSII